MEPRNRSTLATVSSVAETLDCNAAEAGTMIFVEWAKARRVTVQLLARVPGTPERSRRLLCGLSMETPTYAQ